MYLRRLMLVEASVVLVLLDLFLEETMFHSSDCSRPFTDDASLAKLTVSDTKGESLSDEVSEAVVGNESARA